MRAGFFPRGGAKNFFQKALRACIKEAVAPVSARLVDKAIAAHFGTTARYVGCHLGDWHIPMHDT